MEGAFGKGRAELPFSVAGVVHYVFGLFFMPMKWGSQRLGCAGFRVHKAPLGHLWRHLPPRCEEGAFKVY